MPDTSTFQAAQAAGRLIPAVELHIIDSLLRGSEVALTTIRINLI